MNPSLPTRRTITITISLSPEEEGKLSERAARSGQDLASYIDLMGDAGFRQQLPSLAILDPPALLRNLAQKQAIEERLGLDEDQGQGGEVGAHDPEVKSKP